MAPEFFAGIAARLPQITAAEAQLKRGVFRNELTCFRYDVLLEVDGGEVRTLRAVGARLVGRRWSWRCGLRAAHRPSTRAGRPRHSATAGSQTRWPSCPGSSKRASRAASPDGTRAAPRQVATPSSRRRSGPSPRRRGMTRMSVGAADRGAWTCCSDRRRRVVSRWKAPGNSAARWRRARRPTPRSKAESAPRLVPVLRDYLRQRLPDYMVPSAIVAMGALPWTTSGKVDRRRLPDPDRLRPEVEASFVPASTPAESELARIWAELLGLDRVGVRDNFFSLGGDSIMSVQVVARARQAGLSISINQLFQHQTIAGLAAVAIEKAMAPVADAADGAVEGDVPLLPIQSLVLRPGLARAASFEPGHPARSAAARAARARSGRRSRDRAS